VVELTIYRKSAEKKKNQNKKNEVYSMKSVDVAVLLNDSTGYIKNQSFHETMKFKMAC
jgi:carboxyl-terminal processing protease